MKSLLSTLVIIAFAGNLAFSAPQRSVGGPAAPRFEPSKKAWSWAEKTLRKMSVDEKVGQLIHVGINARFANQDSAYFKEIKRQVVDNKVGGIIFFVGPVYETVHLANRMQEAAKLPVLMSLDAETGVGMRFESAIVFPWAMALAATGDPGLARRMGVITGREARSSGFRHVFAPVLDVNNNSENPVINVRSFGEDPEDVAKFGLAFIDGLQSEGVLATAKHFPGHGDTDVDSHRGLPIIDHSRERLDRLELFPFRKAVDAGVASIMIAHIGLPQIDNEEIKPLQNYTIAYTEEGAEIVRPTGTIPATLSHKVQTDILRRDMGFKGLIVSDAMDMSGLTIYMTQAFEPVFREAFQKKFPKIKVTTVVGRGFQLGQGFVDGQHLPASSLIGGHRGTVPALPLDHGPATKPRSRQIFTWRHGGRRSEGICGV